MTALTAPRKIDRLADGVLFNRGVTAGVTCLQGGLAILAAGYARPGRVGQGGNQPAQALDASGYVCDGIFTETVVGGAVDGAKTVNVVRGTWPLKNSAGVDAITNSDVGHHCFVVDDQTVARTSNDDTRCYAGVVAGIDENGFVLVEIDGDRSAKRKVYLPFQINETDTLAGTSAELVSPVAGNITRLQVVVAKAVITGGDVTAAVGVTAVDGLACTIADAAAKGTVVSDTPTAGHASRAVKPGDRIQVIPGAPFNTAGAVNGVLEISY